MTTTCSCSSGCRVKVNERLRSLLPSLILSRISLRRCGGFPSAQYEAAQWSVTRSRHGFVRACLWRSSCWRRLIWRVMSALLERSTHRLRQKRVYPYPALRQPSLCSRRRERSVARARRLSPGSYGVKITADEAMHTKLEQLQHLLRHRVPNGDFAVIIELGLDLLLAKTMKERFGIKVPSSKATSTGKATNTSKVTSTSNTRST